jgi:membrane protease subunit HflK
MSWNDKGGGPWGPPPGANEPRRPSPSGKGPDDLEALLRKGQERLSQMMPEGGNGRLGLIVAVAIVAIVVIVWLLSGTFRVDPNQVAVIQRFGAFVRTEPGGLHYHLPAPIETVSLVDVTNQHVTEVGSRSSGSSDSVTMLTGDSNIIEVDFVVTWQVLDPVKYLFNVGDPIGVLRQAAESAVREVIGQTDVQYALDVGKADIGTRSTEILQNTLDRYNSGIRVAQIQLQRVDAPAPVIDAFNDVQAARTELEQQRNQAQAYANDVVPRARGDAQKMIQDAQAYKERATAEATGEAQQFISVLEAYQKSRDVTTRRMYIDTMETVLEKAHKIIIDPNADGKTGVVPYLPLPGLTPPPAQPAQKGQ